MQLILLNILMEMQAQITDREKYSHIYSTEATPSYSIAIIGRSQVGYSHIENGSIPSSITNSRTNMRLKQESSSTGDAEFGKNFVPFP